MTETRLLSNSGGSKRSISPLQRLLQHIDQSLKASVGGALVVSHSFVSLKNCNFNGNTASFGGAIFSEYSNVTISDTHFSDNHANDSIGGHSDGGALLVAGQGTVAINNSVFHHNTANSDGGMIAVFNSTLSVSWSNVSSNTASKCGGAVAASYDSSIMLNFTNLSKNQADLGGVAYMFESDGSVDNCNILNNTAKHDGGAIYLKNCNTVNVNNSVLNNNQAQEKGGVLSGQNNSCVVFSNCNATKNIANFGGVMQVSMNSSLDISHSNFTDNEAKAKGGVAYVHDGSMITIEYCSFTNNQAGNYGGVVRVDSGSTMNISNSSLDGNTASYGGAIGVNWLSSAFIISCDFSRNMVTNNGGAVEVYFGSNVTIKSSTFDCNVANDVGAAVSGNINCSVSISDSTVCNSMTNFSGGGVHIGRDSDILMENCTFLNNTADFGGAIVAVVSTFVTINNSNFDRNRANIEGGALRAYKKSSMKIFNSNFTSHIAGTGGVSLALLNCELIFQNSTFLNNHADFGGVIGLLERSITTITGGMFTHNTAQSGGVFYVHRSEVVVKMSAMFHLNNAVLFGGVIHASDASDVIINEASFLNNTADNGGVLSLIVNSTGLIKHSDFIGNQASEHGGVVYLNKARISIFASRFNSCFSSMLGGVVSAVLMSEVYISRSNFSHSTAKIGAALAAVGSSILTFTSNSELIPLDISDSEMNIGGNDEIIIHNCSSLKYGGGIYLGESSLCIGTETKLCFNKAGTSGGGIEARNSSVIVNHIIHFVSNEATFGGGLSLSNSNLYDVKTLKSEDTETSMNFVSNQAEYGGALYNNDKEIADVCFGGHPSTSSGCFFQNVSDAFIMNFDNNQAKYGNNLFGGLLDRCAVTNSTGSFQLNGTDHFKSISNVNTTRLKSISSKPVQVCLCENGKRNCGLRSHSIQVKHRSTITLQLAAVDQVDRMVTATVLALCNNFTIFEEQASVTQVINATCSNVSYHVTAPPKPVPYEVIIYADGPCDDKGISKLTINIDVVPCKCVPGLVITIENNNNECKCKCDEELLDYIKKCDPEMDSVERKGVFWISTTNKGDGNFSYVIFPYCPVGYCQSPNEMILVNLSSENGADDQCANNHGGLLCGKCQSGYSLSLSSLKCIQCHKKWYGQLIGIIIASMFAGILLVATILVLNLTVAVGTLNSIIFYANIVYSNRILRQSQLISVFISWLNLDIGFDVCFYEGMDAYTKTWLELAFPAYIISLVVAIILISSHSSAFSNLIGKRNPIATLATLILISYAKLLQTIITIFSFVKSNRGIMPATRWLYDASIVYFGWKHALLFCTAILILVLGLFYTILLFSWQWLLHCPRSKVFNWTRNQKLHAFIDAYHTPHTAKHCYWTGLLLLVRVILYLIAAFSSSVYADPHIPVLATVVVICCLLLFKTVMMIKVYRNWLLNAMDTFMCFNIIIPAIFTLHTFADQSLQSKVINVSIGITIVLLCFIIAFHVYRYGSVKLYTYCQNTKLCKYMPKWLSFIHSQEKSSSSPSDGRLLDVLDSLRQDEPEEIYDQHDKPTSSEISLVYSEESPSSDYCLQLNEEVNQSDYQLNIDKGNRTQQKSCISVNTQQEPNNAKKIELPSYFCQDENIRKPLLEESL